MHHHQPAGEARGGASELYLTPTVLALLLGAQAFTMRLKRWDFDITNCVFQVPSTAEFHSVSYEIFWG